MSTKVPSWGIHFFARFLLPPALIMRKMGTGAQAPERDLLLLPVLERIQKDPDRKAPGPVS